MGDRISVCVYVQPMNESDATKVKCMCVCAADE